MILLKEETSDIYIYVDDLTGKYYYYDGTKLVEIKAPEIGDKEDDSEEEEERRKQIEQDKNDPDYEEESEEEKEARLQRIKDTFDDDNTQQDIENETNRAVYRSRKEIQKEKQKADLAKNKPQGMDSKGLKGFKLSLEKFIANELMPQRQTTYSRINKKYVHSGIIKPGTSRHQSSKVPSMNVYFDQSSSWSTSDVAVGMQAISSLNKYVEEGAIKVFIYYFAGVVSTDQSSVQRYTTSTYKVLEHIKETKPDNVIIMSDGDGEWPSNQEQYARIGKAIIPGSVWFLWRNDSSPHFRQYVRGKKDNSQFMI